VKSLVEIFNIERRAMADLTHFEEGCGAAKLKKAAWLTAGS
jgi:hypothetical protein